MTEPSELVGIPGDKYLTIPEPARHYGLSAKFPQTIDPKDQTFVAQYVCDGRAAGGD